MKKKKIIIAENYLERKPKRHADINWTTADDGKVTLEIENVGWANRIAQALFKRPKTSFVHLDEMGSFLWPKLNGEQNIVELGVLVKEHFGEKAEPLYERLATYFRILESYHFITFKEVK
jgi:hypothetical protein